MRRRRARLIAIAVLGAAALSLPAGAGAGQHRSFELPSPLVDPSTPGGTLQGDRTVPKVNVLLPDGYKRKNRRGYPVLYLLHGANGGTDSWLKDFDLFAGFPGIIVMPDGGMYGMYTDWWNGGARANPSWATYHLNVLRRLVERRYSIRPGRRWHAVAGISMGGQGTLRYAAMLPGYFGSAAGFSAAVPDMQSEDAQLGLNLLPVLSGEEGVNYAAVFGPAAGAYAGGNSPQALAANYAHTRLYLTSGDGTNCPEDPVNPATIALDTVTEERLHAQQAPFAAAARAAGADVTDVTTCGIHTFGVWDRAIPAARRWNFFRPVPEHPRRWAYRTVAASGEMWGLRFRFAAPPSVVAEFRRAGRTLAGSGTGSVTIRWPRNCRMTAELPFERRLSRDCSRKLAR